MTAGVPAVIPLHLDHVGLCVEDIDEATKLYAAVLGAAATRFDDDDLLDCHWVRFQLGNGQLLELVAPRSDRSPYRTFLDKRGPGLHHLSFRVSNLATELARLQELDLPVIGANPDHAGWQELFVHPGSTCGALLHFAVPPGSG